MLLDANENELTEKEKQDVLDSIKQRFYPTTDDYKNRKREKGSGLLRLDTSLARNPDIYSLLVAA